MKYLFINPPSYQYTPSPTAGIPTLLGILFSKGIQCEYIDLNMDFINKILKSNIITQIIEKLDNIYKENSYNDLSEKLNIILQDNDKWNSFKNNLLTLQKQSKLICNILKTPKIYNPVLFRKASLTLRSGLLSYYCSVERNIITTLIDDLEDCRSNLEDPNFNIDISFLIEYMESNINSFKDYYENVIKNIITQDVKCIGISIGHYYQFLPGMSLAYLLKKQYNIHINIGGSFFNDYYKHIKNLSELFSVFFDSISINDNTKTVVELSEYLEGKRELSNIENLITLINGKLNINQTHKMNNICNLPAPEFFGYEKINYLIPNLYLPIRASFGCYWHKCIFCMCSDSDVSYTVKPVEKLIEEIEYLLKKYNTNHFYFWDNSLHPKYLSKLADLLIEKKLDIKYSIYARFEEEFDYNLLMKLKKSGCLLIYWGLDAASDRLLDYINKGIKVDTAKKILKNSAKANIGNIVFIIMGHPSETYNDIYQAYVFAKNVKKFVQDVITVQKCLFVEGSILQKNREFYKQQHFTTLKERQDIADKIKCIFNKFGGVHSIFYMMYLEKFGLKGCNFRFKAGNFLIHNNKDQQSMKDYIYKLLYKFVKNKLKI